MYMLYKYVKPYNVYFTKKKKTLVQSRRVVNVSFDVVVAP